MDNASDQESPQAVFAAYSRGELARQDVWDRLGEPISFGDLLMKLHEYGLPLPRFPSDGSSPGVPLIKRLALRGLHAG